MDSASIGPFLRSRSYTCERFKSVENDAEEQTRRESMAIERSKAERVWTYNQGQCKQQTNRNLDLRGVQCLRAADKNRSLGDRTRAGHNSPYACVETLPRGLNDNIQRRTGTRRCRSA